MSDFTHVRPYELKRSLCPGKVWSQDSFTHIVTAMFSDRPSLCLYAPNAATAEHIMHVYAEFVRMGCEFADTAGYPWMKTKLKDIVWVDFKGFYDTLTRLVCEGIRKMPFDEHDKELMSLLAAIWIKVGTFTDDAQSHIAVGAFPRFK